MKLNVGCGTDIREGWTNVDKMNNEGVDLVLDLDKYPYPFKDNSVDEIYASHFLEHVKDFQRCFKEFTRILKSDGIFHIKVPHFSSSCNFNEFHKTSFTYRSFENNSIKIKTNVKTKESIELYDKYFKDEYRKLNFYTKPYFPWNYLIEPIINLNKYILLFWEYTGLCNLFPAKELEVILRKKV